MTSFIVAVLALVTTCLFGSSAYAQTEKSDIIQTSQGPLKITLVGHASLMLEYNSKIIHIDPWSKMADYSSLPKADLLLITHQHGDHFDGQAMAKVKKSSTITVMTKICANQMEKPDGTAPVIMANGDEKTLAGFKIQAVAAYNLVHRRDDGSFFHPKGDGNGYIIQVADKRIYVAGDTENTPEMKSLQNIDAAFIPMNLPYTMDAAMAADAVKAFKPGIVYPYHVQNSTGYQVPGFIALAGDIDGVDIRDLN